MRTFDDIAFSWVGTPFFPHMAKKGVGADCVHLALAIFQESGELPEWVELPDYSLSQGDHLDQSAVEHWLEETPWFELVDDEPGQKDVVTFRIGNVSHHVGVALSGGRFVHAMRGLGTAVGFLSDSTYAKRLVSTWRLRV